MKFAIVGSGFTGAVLAHEFAKAGFRVQVFESRSHIAGNCYSERDEKTNIILHRYGPHIFHTDNEVVWNYVNQFAEFLPYINRVKTTSQSRVFSLGALCSLFIGKKPRLIVHWHSDVINKGLLGKILRPLETALLRRTDSIVATSQVYAEASETLRNFRDKVVVVPIGVPYVKHVEADAGLSPSIEKQFRGKKIILAVGRLVPYKGFNVLIDAAKHLRDDSVAVIVGGGPLQQELQDAIEFMGAPS